MRVLQAKKPALSLNLRNSKLTKNAFDYLARTLVNPEFYLTALNLKFCFISFEQAMQLANILRHNKTLVKLDLSNNGLKSCVVHYLLESITPNQYLSEVNFSGNFLDDDFAQDLSLVLKENGVLNKVDISENPIGPDGAKLLFNALCEDNDTLTDLGDLSVRSAAMGVRIREELRQVLTLNSSSHDKKKAFIEQLMHQTRTKNADSSKTTESAKA